MQQELRHSRQREALQALLCGVTCHPTAEWLYTELKKTFPKISLATVYRNLGVLCESGQAMRLDVGDGTVHYDADTREHNHLFCRRCRRVSDVGCEAGDLVATLEARYHVSIDSHSFVFYGLCRPCLSEST